MGCDVIKENIPALNYGKEYKPIAKEKYAALMICNHKEFTVTESGLFLDSTGPYLGASPDLLVHCTCCGAGLSEIKCRLSIADEIPSAVNLPYLVECGNVTTLKKNKATIKWPRQKLQPKLIIVIIWLLIGKNLLSCPTLDLLDHTNFHTTIIFKSFKLRLQAV